MPLVAPTIVLLLTVPAAALNATPVEVVAAPELFAEPAYADYLDSTGTTISGKSSGAAFLVARVLAEYEGNQQDL